MGMRMMFNAPNVLSLPNPVFRGVPQIPDLKNVSPLQTLAGANGGTVYWTAPEQGTEKIFSAWFAAYENSGTTNQTITLPTPFVYGGAVVVNTTGLTIAVDTTTVTITSPASTSTFTGFVHIRGL